MKTAFPIGIFDSGLGGLTVVRAIADLLPREKLVYLGDTARVPYGTRSARTVIRYARGCAQRLCQHDIKLLVVACNTVSAVALDMLRVELDIPVLGVIEPGARAGTRASRNGKIGVLATAGTIASGAYVRAISAENSRVEIVSQAAPLLVPLAEEGWTQGDVPTRAIRRYLEPFPKAQVDTIILGCTHYPLFGSLIRKEAKRLCGDHLEVVDSAEATAEELAVLLEQRSLATDETQGSLSLMVTDVPAQFREVASRFLGRDVDELNVTQVDL